MPSIRIAQEQKDETYFLTFTVIDWINIFVNNDYFNSIIDTLKFYQVKYNLVIYGYVIMTNHIHLIARSENMIQFAQGFKSYSTKLICKLLIIDHRKYITDLLNPDKISLFPIWKSTNMPKIINSESYFQQKLEYIHNNPVKKGYVDKAEDWAYSSARNFFLEDDSIINIMTEME